MDAKICDRCRKLCEEKDSTSLWIGNNFYFDMYKFDLCKECRLWLLHELHKKEEWEEEE